MARTSWNKGIHSASPMEGKKHTDIAKHKMSRAKIGKPGNHSGMKHTTETIKLISERRKGKPAWNKGMKMPEIFCKKLSDVQIGKEIPPEQREKISKTLSGRSHSYEHNLKVLEANLGGFWYGNVRYDPPKMQYCELWENVNKRVHAFFDYKCVECGSPENGHSHMGHHVFYAKQACCWYNDSGEYYTNLNCKEHPEQDYYIGSNPNYFVVLCPACHGKTNGKFANRVKWANHFKNLIDTKYHGKCYLTEEEWGRITTPLL